MNTNVSSRLDGFFLPPAAQPDCKSPREETSSPPKITISRSTIPPAIEAARELYYTIQADIREQGLRERFGVAIDECQRVAISNFDYPLDQKTVVVSFQEWAKFREECLRQDPTDDDSGPEDEGFESYWG